MARTSIQAQLLKAWEDSTLTLVQVAELARIKAGKDDDGTDRLVLDEPSLSRKLHGKQTLRTWEAEILAEVLGKKITAGRERRAS